MAQKKNEIPLSGRTGRGIPPEEARVLAGWEDARRGVLKTLKESLTTPYVGPGTPTLIPDPDPGEDLEEDMYDAEEALANLTSVDVKNCLMNGTKKDKKRLVAKLVEVERMAYRKATELRRGWVDEACTDK